jgi:hypothetical protein
LTLMMRPGAFAPAAQQLRPGGILPLATTSRSLSEDTLAALRTSFSKHNHFPSDDMWTALKALADTLEEMANGTCKKAIHLSSLDPGIGKTTTVIHFLKALLASPSHLDVAALVCVRRRDQIEAINLQERGPMLFAQKGV